MSSIPTRLHLSSAPHGGGHAGTSGSGEGPQGGGPIGTLNPRSRLLALAGFALLVVVGLDGTAAVALASGFAVMLAAAARLPVVATLRKVAALDGFMLMALVSLPFTVPGPAWVTVAGLPVSLEGMERALVILLKGNAVALAILALAGTMDTVTLGRALSRLGAPDKFVHLYFFTIRYLDVLGEEYRRLRTAMKARAFRLTAGRHGWRSLGWLFGMLMVRSVERAERITEAMRCRGFDGRLRSLRDDGPFRRQDRVFALVSTAGLVLLIAVAGL